MRAITIALLTCAVACAAESPFVGSWKMNLAKSKLDPNGPKLESAVSQFSQDGPALKGVITTNGTAGTPVILDGKEHAFPAGATILANNATHYTSTVKGKTIQTVFKKDGKIIGTRKSTLSADGKTITATTDGTLPDGKKTHSVFVLEKQ